MTLLTSPFHPCTLHLFALLLPCTLDNDHGSLESQQGSKRARDQG